MKAFKRIFKKVTHRELDHDEFEGTLQELADRVQGWIEKYGWDARIDHDYECDRKDWASHEPFEITSKREENDEEYKKRVDNIMERKALELQRDAEEYERLKKLFDKGESK